MNREDWIDAGGFLSAMAMLAGLGCSLLIPGMAWAALAGVAPGLAYCLAWTYNDWGSKS